jgi:hypothetical protein
MPAHSPTPYIDARQLKSAAKVLRAHGYVLFAKYVKEIGEVIEQRAAQKEMDDGQE